MFLIGFQYIIKGYIILFLRQEKILSKTGKIILALVENRCYNV